MTTASRHYHSAPVPPPPDESYWTALLAQEETDLDHTRSAEEAGWSDEDAFRKTILNGHHGLLEDWQAAEQAAQADQTLQLAVIGYNKGGLLVEWKSLRGFIPASQLVDNLSSKDVLPALDNYIGQHLSLRVIEINQHQNRLILSERAALVSPGTRAAIFEQLQPDTLQSGIVTNICHFGVFVDLGGVEGLIHISELSWGRVDHPSEIVQRGQTLQVYVMDVYPEEGRVALSLKRLLPDPWQTVESRYQVGQVVETVITSVVDFGAFAALQEGLEGLIHISELAEGHFLHPRNVVREGERVRTRILNIDPQARRIGLSLRK